MNAVDVGAWSANWVWSLPLIVLTGVIHVIGLGLINESLVRTHRRIHVTAAGDNRSRACHASCLSGARLPA